MTIRWPWTLIFASTPVSFDSRYDLDESVRRLAKATDRGAESVRKSQRAVGIVTARQVSLQRVAPFVASSFKASYEGAFYVADGRVQLRGAFNMTPAAKTTCVSLVGGILFIFSQYFWDQVAAKSGFQIEAFILVGVALLVLLAIVQLVVREVQSDIEWFERMLCRALSEAADD